MIMHNPLGEKKAACKGRIHSVKLHLGSTDLPFAATFVEIEILFFRFPSVFSVNFLHVRQKSGFGLMEGRERKGRGGWGVWEHANTWVLDPSPHAS